jgi:hypothetical protein
MWPDEAVRLRQRTLVDAIQTKVEPAARQGDIPSAPVAELLRRQLAMASCGTEG